MALYTCHVVKKRLAKKEEADWDKFNRISNFVANDQLQKLKSPSIQTQCFVSVRVLMWSFILSSIIRQGQLIHLKVCTIVYFITQQQTLKFVHYLTLVILGKVR